MLAGGIVHPCFIAVKLRLSGGNNIFLKSSVVTELEFKLGFSGSKANALNFYHMPETSSSTYPAYIREAGPEKEWRWTD